VVQAGAVAEFHQQRAASNYSNPEIESWKPERYLKMIEN
jgi:hypothetical protein